MATVGFLGLGLSWALLGSAGCFIYFLFSTQPLENGNSTAAVNLCLLGALLCTCTPLGGGRNINSDKITLVFVAGYSSPNARTMTKLIP